MPDQAMPKAQIVPVYYTDANSQQQKLGMELCFQKEDDFRAFLQSNPSLPLSEQPKTEQGFIVRILESVLDEETVEVSQNGVWQYKNGEFELIFQTREERKAFIKSTGLASSAFITPFNVISRDSDVSLSIDNRFQDRPILVFNPTKYFPFSKPPAIHYVKDTHIELRFPENILYDIKRFRSCLVAYCQIFPITGDGVTNTIAFLPKQLEFSREESLQFFKKLLGLDDNATLLTTAEGNTFPLKTQSAAENHLLPKTIKDAVIKKIKAQRGRNPWIAKIMAFFGFKLRLQKLEVTNKALQHLEQTNMSFEDFEKCLSRFHAVQAQLDSRHPPEKNFNSDSLMHLVKTPQLGCTMEDKDFRVKPSVIDVRRYDEVKKILRP